MATFVSVGDLQMKGAALGRDEATQLVAQNGMRWAREGAISYKGGSAAMTLRPLSPPGPRVWAKRVPRARSAALGHEAAMLQKSGSALRPLALVHTAEYTYLLMPRRVGNAFALQEEIAHSYPPGSRASAALRIVCRQMLLMSLQELTRLHAHRLFHRDIKPEHLLFDFDGSIVLSDFGSAQEGAEAAPGLSTLGYLGPEAFQRGDCAPEKLDVYAVGASVFTVLSGAAPLLYPAAQAFQTAIHVSPHALAQRAAAMAEALRVYGAVYAAMAQFAATLDTHWLKTLHDGGAAQWSHGLQVAASRDAALLQILLALMHPRQALRPAADEALQECRCREIDVGSAALVSTLAVRHHARGRLRS